MFSQKMVQSHVNILTKKTITRYRKKNNSIFSEEKKEKLFQLLLKEKIAVIKRFSSSTQKKGFRKVLFGQNASITKNRFRKWITPSTNIRDQMIKQLVHKEVNICGVFSKRLRRK